MKKFIISLAAILLLIFGGAFMWYKSAYGGTDYYVQITTDGQKKTDSDSKGNTYVDYSYSLDGKSKDGKEQKLDFNANKDRPLKKDAWLKVTYNKIKGVTTWQEVQPSEVPAKAK